MRILAINGSPKGKESTTFMMIEEVLKGFRKHAWTDDHILLSEHNIHHCLGCFHCWRTDGSCVFKDDMEKIRPLLDADILLLGTPLYVDNVTGLMKNFLDRSVARGNPFIALDKNQESIHPRTSNRSNGHLIMLSNCGFSEQTQFEALKTFAKRMARNTSSTLIGEIYRTQGPLLHNKTHSLQPIIDTYKALLQRAGEELATTFSLSKDTQEKLEKTLIPIELYNQNHNSFFQKEKCRNKEAAAHLAFSGKN